jgi:hypothetical protein
VYICICICIYIHMYMYMYTYVCTKSTLLPIVLQKKKKQQRVTIEGASFGLALRSVAVIFPPLRKLNLMPKPYA